MPDTTYTGLNILPPSTFFASADGNILTINEGDLGDADTSYTYFDLLKAGFNAFVMQHIIEATTLTYEMTGDLYRVADADAEWLDVTLDLTAGAYAQFVETGGLIVSLAKGFSRMRVKRVTTNPTNSLKLILTRVKI